MRTIQSLYLAGAIAAGATLTATAEEFRTDINPALRYYHAFVLMSDANQSDRDYLVTNDWHGQHLPEKYGQCVSNYDGAFKTLHQASAATVPCDWGIDMSDGPGTLVPHYVQAKRTAILAQARVMWFLQNKRESEACDDLLATFTMARQLSRDGSLMSRLVQQALEAIVFATVADNFHCFSPATLDRLEKGFEQAPPRGTIAEGLLSDKRNCHDWLLRRIEQIKKDFPSDGTKQPEALREALSLVSDDEKVANSWFVAAGGTIDGLVKSLNDMDPWYPRFIKIVSLPFAESQAEMGKFMAEATNSPNPGVAALFPTFQRARQREVSILIRESMMRAAIEYKLHGEAGMKSVADPCGSGPFTFNRFMFEGVDRGFQLTSAFTARGYPESMIFVEKEGPLFRIDGPYIGKARPKN